jgi:RNA polymerase sigma factor (TIGR02999 family)
MSDTLPLTTLLKNWRKGDKKAGDNVMELAYTELHRLAARYLRGERKDHTLSATALVNEMYLRLAASEPIDWQDRGHFFAIAATQLRRVLVNYARDRQALKRGGKQIKLALTDMGELSQPAEQHEIVALDEALTALETLDPRAAKVVELRYFGGLTEAESAEVLGISVATLKRDWTWARALLIANLKTPST